MAKKEKTRKPPLRQRIRTQLRAASDAGTKAVRNPRSIPGTAGGFFRRWFRKLWELRGGGLYAVGYAATFIWLEIATLFGEIFGAESVQQFVSSQLFEFFFRFLSDSIANMVTAFMWPVFFIGYRPPLGIFVLVAAFLLFPHFVKPVLEKWLSRDEEAESR